MENDHFGDSENFGSFLRCPESLLVPLKNHIFGLSLTASSKIDSKIQKLHLHFFRVSKMSKTVYTYAQNAKCWFSVRGHKIMRASIEKATEAFETLWGNVEKRLGVILKIHRFFIGNNRVELDVQQKSAKTSIPWIRIFAGICMLRFHLGIQFEFCKSGKPFSDIWN